MQFWRNSDNHRVTETQRKNKKRTSLWLCDSVVRVLMSGVVESRSSHSTEAGHWGQDVRSDVHVAFEPRDSGGVEISLESRVAPYYGNTILEQARQALE